MTFFSTFSWKDIWGTRKNYETAGGLSLTQRIYNKYSRRTMHARTVIHTHICTQSLRTFFGRVPFSEIPVGTHGQHDSTTNDNCCEQAICVWHVPHVSSIRIPFLKKKRDVFLSLLLLGILILRISFFLLRFVALSARYRWHLCIYVRVLVVRVARDFVAPELTCF